MKKLLLALPVAAFLVACSAPSADDLAKNTDKLVKVSIECGKLEMKGKDISNNEKCNNAALAMVKVLTESPEKAAEITTKIAAKLQ